MFYSSETVVGRVGLEPTTNGLKGRCSTTELPTRLTRGRKLNDCHDQGKREVEPGTLTCTDVVRKCFFLDADFPPNLVEASPKNLLVNSLRVP